MSKARASSLDWQKDRIVSHASEGLDVGAIRESEEDMIGHVLANTRLIGHNRMPKSFKMAAGPTSELSKLKGTCRYGHFSPDIELAVSESNSSRLYTSDFLALSKLIRLVVVPVYTLRFDWPAAALRNNV